MQAAFHEDPGHQNLRMSATLAKVSDMSRNEMEEKLRDVLKENLELKEILEHNNAAMKQQFETLRAWQDQMNTIHEEHKQKFDATRELVTKLKVENQELTNKARTLENALHKTTPTTSANNSQDKSTSASQSPKCSQLAEIASHISVEEAKSAMQYEREKTMRVHLEQTVQELREEMEKMKLTIQNRAEQTANPDLSVLLGESTPRSMSPSMSWDSSDVLYESNGCTAVTSPGRSPARKKMSEYMCEEAQTMTSGQDLRISHDDQNKIIHLTQLLIEEKKRVTVLQRRLESKTKVKDQGTSSSIDIQSQQLIKELKISEEKFNNANNYLQKYKERCDSLENWLSVYQGKLESLRTKDNDTIDQLRSELENMRSTLKNEQKAKLDEQKNLQDARQQLQKLVKDYQELTKTWEGFQREQENKDRQQEAWSEIQQRQMQERLDRLTAKLVTSEEARSHMNQDLAILKSQSERNQREIESIPILKSQVELYKEDLEKEKESKQKLLQSVTRLQSELQVLQSQNHQLLDEINAYNEAQISRVRKDNNNFSPSRKIVGKLYQAHQENVPVEVQDAPVQSTSFLPSDIRESVSSVRLSNGVETNRNFFYCPKCSIGYSNYSHLLKHVEACLNTTD